MPTKRAFYFISYVRCSLIRMKRSSRQTWIAPRVQSGRKKDEERKIKPGRHSSVSASPGCTWYSSRTIEHIRNILVMQRLRQEELMNSWNFFCVFCNVWLFVALCCMHSSTCVLFYRSLMTWLSREDLWKRAVLLLLPGERASHSNGRVAKEKPILVPKIFSDFFWDNLANARKTK